MKLNEVYRYSYTTMKKIAAEYLENQGDFNCAFEKLSSLKDGPKKVQFSYDCSSNNLKSLEGAPEEIEGNFNCSNNDLQTLKGAPKKIKCNFNCNTNKKLTSLKGGPSYVEGDYKCRDCALISLEGAPSEVGDFYCSSNNLTSLKGIHKIIKKMNDGTIQANNNIIRSHVLGVLLIPGCVEIILDNKKVEKIINKHLPNHEGMVGVLKCQEELFAADLDDFAQL